MVSDADNANEMFGSATLESPPASVNEEIVGAVLSIANVLEFDEVELFPSESEPETRTRACVLSVDGKVTLAENEALERGPFVEATVAALVQVEPLSNEY